MTFVEAEPTPGPSADRPEQSGPPQFPRPSTEEMKTVTLIKQRWSDGEQELMKARRHYWENFGFFLGEQWTWWSDKRRQLMAYAEPWSPLGEGRARLTKNRIEPNIINVLARMLATPLSFEVPPTDAADDTISGAALAEDVLEAEHHDQQWGRVRYDELMLALMGGTSAVSVEWDGSGGTQLEVDEKTNRVVGTGAARLRALGINEFCVEPGVSDARRARWWECGLTMPPREAQTMYGLDWTPNADAAALLSPLQHKILADAGRPQGTNQCLVLCCYERPNPQTPKGRYSVVINNRLVHDEAWPFPFKDRLNLVTFRQEQLSGKWTGWTYMVSAVKMQAQYNFYGSMIAELMKKVGTPRMFSPDVLDEQDFNDNPDSIIFYPAGPGISPPGYVVPPSMPGWIAEEINDCKETLDEFMHVSQTSQGQSIGDRASGQALALLSEKDDSPLGLMGTEQAEGWSQIAEMVLALYAKHATETRTIALRNPNAPYMRRFTGAMLHDQTRVYVDPDTTKPVSKAAMQAFAKDLWDRKIITDPGMYARLSQLPDNLLAEVIQADVASAMHENTLMSIGTVVVPEAFEDHAVHIAEHNRFRKSRGYRYADRMIRELIDHHVQAHETMQHEQLGAQTGRALENPALAQVAQGNEPPGSMVPPDFAEAQAGLAGDPTAAAMYPQGGGPPQAGSGLGPPPTEVPATADLGPGESAPGLTSGVT